jgi:hypothetical protein
MPVLDAKHDKASLQVVVQFEKRSVSGHRFSTHYSEWLQPQGLARQGTAAKACVLCVLLAACLKGMP